MLMHNSIFVKRFHKPCENIFVNSLAISSIHLLDLEEPVSIPCWYNDGPGIRFLQTLTLCLESSVITVSCVLMHIIC